MRLALFGESFGYFGLAILGSTYIIGWIQDQKMRKAAHASGQALRFGIVPQFTLADLFTLIFSLGFYPIVAMHLYKIDANDSAGVFISAAGAFPAFFTCALYRTETNAVPRGWVRTAFLAITPYVFYGTWSFVVFPADLVSPPNAPALFMALFFI